MGAALTGGVGAYFFYYNFNDTADEVSNIYNTLHLCNEL